jgi:glycosyltransferase involved in cell wall biosynthesis
MCVAPSLWENFPYSALEAMACGLPVVATRTGGLPEMIEDGETGLLVPPGDDGALAQAICSLLECEPRRAEMGLRARQRVEEAFAAGRVAADMARFYRIVEGMSDASKSRIQTPGAQRQQ